MFSSTMEVVPCPPDQRAEALWLLYRRAPESLRASLVTEALEDAETHQLDLSGLWIARRRGKLSGALLTQSLAGRAAAVWPPEIDGGWGRKALGTALVRSALDDLRSQGFRVAQALLDESTSRSSAAALIQGGMPHVTDLVYLGRSTEASLGLPLSAPLLEWESFGPATEPEFRSVLVRTYLGSLDMPELEGVRSLDDVMSGHQASGRFDPTRWQMGRLASEPEACALLLLADQPDRDAWEVAYLGLAPEARGRGLGHQVLARALELARPHRPRLELAVDTRNEPAVRLYRAAGFT
ncbi:MAG TPA: GNAT family N-acetyltransferase, partial [Isosphaeraceae bacterium]|nr:GNAT family N-acetyltransferase [Isosphaeraceae bacterium]